jgi:hypothetical protein
MTWLYLQSETPSEAPPYGLYTVGHYDPRTNRWVPESDHDTADKAAARVHYLNGGSDELRKALEDLTTRCDGEEGVRADGSNVQTAWAHAVLDGR